ncbi:hypothetical protein FM106_01160 [Brachybacterium faecium]|nr:hypothetical protein FM106_01160 [Brachybacterium faecium]
MAFFTGYEITIIVSNLFAYEDSMGVDTVANLFAYGDNMGRSKSEYHSLC